MRYGFVIDHNRCIGCHACTVACKEEHQVPVGVFRTWVKYVEKGEFPHTSRHFGVLRCNHCDDAPCIEICPTHALYRRHDGIVDFDNTRCIGCKGCMQACPYDALYIDPNNNTAAKCNFCAHRVENNMEPACVIVCPTQAIFAGDLDDAGSTVSRIVATQKVSVRKPEKGTKPKLFYVGIEPDLLDPTKLSRQTTDMFSDRRVKPEASEAADAALTREVYDVAHPVPWGWKIAAYLWTKSIAAGVMLVAAIVILLSGESGERLFCVAAPLVALVALAATSMLLIFDLKRPGRFVYLLTKPNFKSWLVLGAYVLMAYGVLIVIWLWCGLVKHYVPGAVSSATAVLAVASACYSAFLFAQAKGRDLWQGRMLFYHLVVHALICGSATLCLMGLITDGFMSILRWVCLILVVSLIASLIMILAEAAIPHGSAEVKLAMRALTRGKLSIQFWGLAIGIGILCPLGYAAALIFAGAGDYAAFLLPLHALVGVWAYEDVWVKAGQAVPLS
jgi:Fe-S-cluster-containing dehydrogenase component/formate-dependent nitrite reductase membrane component NrfD